MPAFINGIQKEEYTEEKGVHESKKATESRVLKVKKKKNLKGE